jgi:hypothetical protein
MTPLEQRLSKTPHREIPAELRASILAAARSRRFPLRIPHFVFRIFSWPHPLAWGAVAAGWIAIAALNFSGPRGEALYAVTPKDYKGRLPTAREYLVQFQIRDRLLAYFATDVFEPQPLHYLRRDDL